MKVAIVHDDLVQWGGAERVLLGLCEIFPNSPIFTSVFDRTNKELVKKFGDKKITTSFLQKIPGWKKIYKPLLPFYPIAFEQFNFDKYDLVISHTTRFAKAIITKPKTIHISFVHTPPRFLWHFPKREDFGVGEILLTQMRVFDQISSKRVDYFLAGSKNAQKRIRKIYGRESKIVYPFIDLERFKNIETFDGGYFLVISRGNKYKKLDLAIKACSELGVPLKIIGEQDILSDEMVVKVLAGCSALIIPGIEDFGLVSLEAQALGKPIIAFAQGGNLETVIAEKTGIFFEEQNIESLKGAIARLNKAKIDPSFCKENAQKFSYVKFKYNFVQVLDSLGYTI